MTETTGIFDSIFRLVGHKLKGIAKFILVAGILASIILGFIMFANAGDASESYILGDSLSGFYTTLGFIILIGGTIMSVTCSFTLYAFGAITEKYLDEKQQRAEIYKAHNMYNSQNSNYQNSSPISSNYWICPKCGMLVQNSTRVCGNCGTTKEVNNNTSARELKPGEWVCPKCGKINAGYVGTCGCGEVKSESDNRNIDLSENQDKSIGYLNKMLLNGQITQEEFERRYAEVVNENASEQQTKNCPKCNAELREDSVFCVKCGTKVK